MVVADLSDVPTDDLFAELVKRKELIQQNSENLSDTAMPPRPTNFYRRWVQPTWEDYTKEMYPID